MGITSLKTGACRDDPLFESSPDDEHAAMARAETRYPKRCFFMMAFLGRA
jgi:hypothetical protein